MSKNQKKKTDLRSAVLVLLLIAVLMVASTYAWFTANKTVTVNQINVNVAASKGLQISTNCVDWKSIISNEDIMTNAYSGNKNYIPASTSNLEPVSTDGTVSSGKLNMFYGTVEADSDGEMALTSVADAEPSAADKTGHYVVFDLFLKLDTANTSEKIYLTPTSDVKTSSGSAGLKNAARIAFLNEGTDATGTGTGSLNYSAATSSVIWEPNYGSHLQAGVDAYKDIYKLNALTLTAGDSNAIVPYVGVSSAVTGVKLPASAVATEGKFTEVTPGIKTLADNNTAGVEAFTLNKGITKIKVYYWVEGQDIDCENSASGSSINLDFGFTLNATNE